MAIFEVYTWTAVPAFAAEHEAVIDKYLFLLKLLKSKIGKLISLRYLSAGFGRGNPLGGRILIMEYENFGAYEEFQNELVKREDYQGFQRAWSKLIIPSTLHAQLWMDRNRGAWFSGKGTEIQPA